MFHYICDWEVSAFVFIIFSVNLSSILKLTETT